MVEVPPTEQIAEDWRIGTLATPPIHCPYCGKRTRALYTCPWCKKDWDEAEIGVRQDERLLYYSRYDPLMRVALKQRGYY